jgi:hypothetical protein
VSGGRPSKYLEEYCDQLISAATDGYSVTAFAGMIDVSRDTLYEWSSKHPEFSDALNKAKAKTAIYWENRLRTAGSSAEVTASIFALKNRVAAEWRDKQDIEMTGKDGAPLLDGIKVTFVNGS